jgi:putative SOS response-associated peptidase YedK
MCGRFVPYSSRDTIAQAFDLCTMPDLEPRYNIAPTQSVTAVRSSHSPAFLIHYRTKAARIIFHKTDKIIIFYP